jgi:FlaA1/EpsC-like NDP-sugar epimerase
LSGSRVTKWLHLRILNGLRKVGGKVTISPRRRLSLRGRHLLVFDAAASVGSFIVSLGLRFDAPSPQFAQYVAAFVWAIPLLLVVRLAAFVAFRLYQRVWRYASVDELIAVVFAVASSSVFAYVVIYAVVVAAPVSIGFPRSVVVIDTILMVALAGAWRFGLRLWGIGRAGAHTRQSTNERALIVGDGSAALATIRELRANPELGLKAIGVLAHDLPVGQSLMSLPVLGRRADLQTVVRREGIKVVLLALPSADGRTLRRLVRDAEAAGARCLTVPSIAEVMAGRVTMNAIRDVEVEDLLRRAPSRIDLHAVSESFRDSCVLITGAGGSIGGELSRQVLAFHPRRLVLLGRGENSIFETLHSLQPSGVALEILPVIMDVRDQAQLHRVFMDLRPDVVFHAAAHKHVGFMESFPAEAVKTNVVGTANVLDAAVAAGVRRLVFISTDKAVNPTSVMGTTKRIGELLVADAALESGLPYTSVRFGNVLSSRGSVVPLFRQQLARGGPLTVTDPDAMRYFMTIPEAVQLVLQAAVMAGIGDTFVLDMGEPVRIAELARDLIELSGLEPERDIKVEFIGQRRGEKLVEELYFAFERPEPTAHEAIRRVRNHGERQKQLKQQVAQLRLEAEAGDIAELMRWLPIAVPEYTPAPVYQATTRAANERD